MPPLSRTLTPILFVEDNDEMRYAVTHLLESEGYSLAATDDPLAALDLLRSRAPISLVVLDLHMPNMDGFAFLQRVKDDPMIRRVPVVIFSADSGRQEPEGAAAVVRKDHLDVLLEVVRRLRLPDE